MFQRANYLIYKGCSYAPSSNLLTIPWLVDIKEQLLEMLQLEYVDGFVSNNSVELLQILTNACNR